MGTIMDGIQGSVKERLADAAAFPLENDVRKYVLKEFAASGRPPTLQEIKEGLALPSVEVVSQAIGKLEAADVLSAQGGVIVSAYPFSAVETRHRVVFDDGREVYALCATDALGIHFMMNEDITVMSRCPRCESQITVVVKSGGIDSYSPEGIIEFVGGSTGCGCAAETVCPFINMFCSGEHLEQWRKDNPEYEEGEVYSVTEALEHGKAIFGDFLT